jgi:hypothetical protein
MIGVEVFEPNIVHPYKIIYFRNQKGKVIRHIWVDNDNRIIRDYLYERRPDEQIICVVLYGADHIKPLGVREIVYDALDRMIEDIQYEICDGKKIQIHKAKHCYEGDKGRCNKVLVYGRSNEPVGYTLYTYDDAGIAPVGNYDMNGQLLVKFDLERLF